MLFSYNWLQLFFSKKLPAPQKLAEILTLRFAEVEGVKKEDKDHILEIDVRPNRAGDCLSHLGVAREIAAILNYKLQIPNYKLPEDKKSRAADLISIDVRSKSACLRYSARVARNISVGPSPKWLKEKLEVLGQRSINNIVDATNYVMLELGQPLHTFDLDKIEDKKIIVRFAKTEEKIVTLDNEKYDLKDNILIIADANSPLAIAGIKGGKKAEITETTKSIVIESANFNSRVVRLGSKTIDLKTEASIRFEHGIDPNLTEAAINRAAGIISEIGGGKVAKGLVDFYPVKVLPKRIKLDLERVESLLGIKIPAQKIKKILESLGFKIKNSLVEVPTHRLDVNLPEDLVEEIGRIYGYEKIPAVLPTAVLIPPKRNEEIFWEDMAKDILKEADFTEVWNYSFLSKEQLLNFGFVPEKALELENPLSLDFQYLRPSLIPGLLNNIINNQKNFREIKLFELGKIFQSLKVEKRMLTGVMTGDKFYEAKGVIDSLLNKLGISDIWYDDYKATPEASDLNVWDSKKMAEIKVGQEEIGFLGEISGEILRKMRIEGKIAVFDIDFEKLQKQSLEETIFRPIFRFPSAVRDIAILVPLEIKVDEVLNEIEIAGGQLLKDVDLFDIYEGEELPGGKKNLAFHLIFQAEDKTLSSKEIDDVQNKIINILEQNPGWQVRK